MWRWTSCSTPLGHLRSLRISSTIQCFFLQKPSPGPSTGTTDHTTQTKVAPNYKSCFLLLTKGGFVLHGSNNSLEKWTLPLRQEAQLGMAAHTYNPKSREAEGGGSVSSRTSSGYTVRSSLPVGKKKQQPRNWSFFPQTLVELRTNIKILYWEYYSA